MNAQLQSSVVSIGPKKPTLTIPEGKKVYVLDKNILKNHPDAMFSFEDNVVVIPLVVIDDIDRTRNNVRLPTDVRYTTERVFENLNSLRQYGSLESGVTMPNGGIVYVARNGYDWNDLPDGLSKSDDNIVMLVAISMQRYYPDVEVVLISDNLATYTKADALGIVAQEYMGGKAYRSAKDIYSGRVHLTFREDFDVQPLLASSGDIISIVLTNDAFEEENAVNDLVLNQCCYLHHHATEHTTLALYKGDGNFVTVISNQSYRRLYPKIMPKNDEQAFALALAMDPSLDIVSFNGPAGTGKTLMALLGALVEDTGKYSAIKVYRVAIEADDTLGFTPGEQEDKFNPWTLPIVDALEVIVGPSFSASENHMDKKGTVNPALELIRSGQVTIEPPNHLRGRTLPRVVIIIDDAQNTTRELMKLIVTRAGEGTKVIVIGDHSQIDRTGLTATSNGHAHLIRSFAGADNFGHITLEKTVRSRLAEQAAARL